MVCRMISIEKKIICEAHISFCETADTMNANSPLSVKTVPYSAFPLYIKICDVLQFATFSCLCFTKFLAQSDSFIDSSMNFLTYLRGNQFCFIIKSFH